MESRWCPVPHLKPLNTIPASSRWKDRLFLPLDANVTTTAWWHIPVRIKIIYQDFSPLQNKRSDPDQGRKLSVISLPGAAVFRWDGAGFLFRGTSRGDMSPPLKAESILGGPAASCSWNRTETSEGTTESGCHQEGVVRGLIKKLNTILRTFEIKRYIFEFQI